MLAFHHHRRAIGLRPHGAEEASDAGHEHSRPWLHWPHNCRPLSSFPEREPDGPHCTLHNSWCHQLTRALEAPSSFAIAAFSLRSTCDVGGTRRKPRHYNRPLDIGEPGHLQVQFHLRVVLRVLHSKAVLPSTPTWHAPKDSLFSACGRPMQRQLPLTELQTLGCTYPAPAPAPALTSRAFSLLSAWISWACRSAVRLVGWNEAACLKQRSCHHEAMSRGTLPHRTAPILEGLLQGCNSLRPLLDHTCKLWLQQGVKVIRELEVCSSSPKTSTFCHSHKLQACWRSGGEAHCVLEAL